MMPIKPKVTDVKGDTVCIICALGAVAIIFMCSVALVIVLHTRDIAANSDQGESCLCYCYFLYRCYFITLVFDACIKK